MLFDSKKKHTVRIDPREQREIEIIEKEGLEVGREYELEDGTELQILRIILPRYAETKDTVILRKYPDGSYEYSTPDAIGSQCQVLHRNKDKKWGSCSPSEFVKMLKRSSEGRPKSKKLKDDKPPGTPKGIPKATADQIKKSGENAANGTVKFMEDANW